MSVLIQDVNVDAAHQRELKVSFDMAAPAFIANPVPYYHAFLAGGPYQKIIGVPSTIVPLCRRRYCPA